VIRGGSGTENIDKVLASKLDIAVSNCPGMNKDAVAELAMGLALSIDRKIPDNVQDLNNG